MSVVCPEPVWQIPKHAAGMKEDEDEDEEDDDD